VTGAPPLAALLALALASPPAATAVWQIRSPPSHADFGVRLLWLHTIRGRFERIEGAVQPRDDGRVVVNARIAVDSLAMASPRTRRWVLGKEFFDAAHYPSLRFVSVPVPRAALDEGGVLAGALTLRGVTRPVHLELRPARCTADACTIEARGELRRGEFGMNGRRPMLADRVELALSIAIARHRD
jgi:polyisoprenoid-binding protein YceI